MVSGKEGIISDYLIIVIIIVDPWQSQRSKKVNSAMASASSGKQG